MPVQLTFIWYLQNHVLRPVAGTESANSHWHCSAAPWMHAKCYEMLQLQYIQHTLQQTALLCSRNLDLTLINLRTVQGPASGSRICGVCGKAEHDTLSGKKWWPESVCLSSQEQQARLPIWLLHCETSPHATTKKPASHLAGMDVVYINTACIASMYSRDFQMGKTTHWVRIAPHQGGMHLEADCLGHSCGQQKQSCRLALLSTCLERCILA